MKYLCGDDGFQEEICPLKVDGVRFFFPRFAFYPLPSGMDDFSLAKVERPKGDGKYRPSRNYFARQFSAAFPFCAKMGIPKTLKRNSLPYTFPLALSLSRAKKKSIPDKDMGIKKSSPPKEQDKRK